MRRGICKLCQEETELRYSHLFPEFLYYSIYDENHRGVGLAPVPGAQETPVQQGLREYLLGACCEGRLQKLESYAASALRRLPDTTRTKPGTLAVATDVEYRQFKLFQLSLIWRASIATQPSFHEVDLGPHEPVIRKMLLDGDPGEPLDYPCLLLHTAGAEPLLGLVKFPGKSRLMGHRIYHMIAAGHIWIYFISAHTRSIRENRSFLSRANELPINVSSVTAEQFIHGLGQNLHSLGVI